MRQLLQELRLCAFLKSSCSSFLGRDKPMTDAKNEPVMCAGPHLDVRPPKLKLPPKSADCHCHVFGPRDQYPWAANRLYTPPPVLLDDYLAMLRATGFERGVMVQTRLYGPDNRFIVD